MSTVESGVTDEGVIVEGVTELDVTDDGVTELDVTDDGVTDEGVTESSSSGSPGLVAWRVSPHQVGSALLIAVLLLFPLDHPPYDMLNTAILASENLIVAISLVMLIGLVGQISLAQATMVGMGAFSAALAVHHFSLAFPFTLLVGAAAGATAAAVIGAVALRVRGLFFAVATLIFAYVGDNYLFVQPWLVQSQSGTAIHPQTVGTPNTIPFLQLANAHDFYYVALAAALVCIYVVANLRDSAIGRAFTAVRGSEVAAESLGINVVRTKLVAFLVAGALAGFGGALILSAQSTINPTEFNFTQSLFFLSIAVVGGLRSLGGVLASSLLFALMVGELFYRVPAAANYLDIISAALLLGVLLFFRGGLASLPVRLRSFSDHRAMRGAARAAADGTGRPAPPGKLAGSAGRLQTPMVALNQAIGPVVRRFVLDPIRSAGRAVMAKVQWLVGRLAALAWVVGQIATRSLSRISGASKAARNRGAARMHLAVPTASAPGDREGSTGMTGQTESPLDIEALGLGSIDITALASTLRSPKPSAVPDRPSAVPELRQGAVALDPKVLSERLAGVDRSPGTLGAGGRRTPWLLSAEGITVRFGGLTAVQNASLFVGAGEIVGLIGPNGAGKTTLFNSILGLNVPSEGRVELYGRDVSDWPVYARAALGVGRTFQVLQLFGELTVFDNLLAATWLEFRSSVASCLLASHPAQQREQAARARVEAVLELTGLTAYGHRVVAGLPFGVLRLVELARTLVTGARLICLDEPSSGLDSTETERFIIWLQLLRRLGLTLLVIEHDVDMVMRLCDYIYVLDQGKLIAEGTPEVVRNDHAVIASYLGQAEESA